MTNIAQYNYPAFDAAAAALRMAGYEVFNPAETDFGVPADQVTHRMALAIDLPQVCACDGLALLRGWETSLGARAERATAVACDLVIGMVEEFLFS